MRRLAKTHDDHPHPQQDSDSDPQHCRQEGPGIGCPKIPSSRFDQRRYPWTRRRALAVTFALIFTAPWFGLVIVSRFEGSAPQFGSAFSVSKTALALRASITPSPLATPPPIANIPLYLLDRLEDPVHRLPTTSKSRLVDAAVRNDPHCIAQPHRNYIERPIAIVSEAALETGPREPEISPSRVLGIFNRTTRSYEQCPLPCVFNPNHVNDTDLDVDLWIYSHRSAQAVLRSSARPETLCPHRKTGVASVESEQHYPFLALDPPPPFDFIATPRLASDVPLLYPSWAEYDFYAPAVPFHLRNPHTPAVAFVSDCEPSSNRLSYITALEDAGLLVDVFAPCRHRGGARRVPPWPERVPIMSRYKFALVFESAIVDDYVTEGLFQALQAGAVPVVRGPRNVARFAPAEKGVMTPWRLRVRGRWWRSCAASPTTRRTTINT